MIPLTSSPKRGYHALNGDLAKRKVLTSIKFLEKCAEFFTQKIKCSEEKALHAIIKAEEAKRIYHNIRELLGKDCSPLTHHWPSGQAQGSLLRVMGSYPTQWTSMYVLVNPNTYGTG